jgi:hypothetical protein
MSVTLKLFPIIVPDDVLTRASIGELALGDDTMSIVCAIPWEMIAPYERRVKLNHRRGLRALMGRGGLEAHEAVAAIEGRELDDLDWREANARLCALLASHGAKAQAA